MMLHAWPIRWHLGFHNASSLLPTSRGFDSFFGYLSGEQDHFTQTVKIGGFGTPIGCAGVVDLTDSGNPARGRNGTYTGWMYNQQAVAVAETAPEPFFLNCESRCASSLSPLVPSGGFSNEAVLMWCRLDAEHPRPIPSACRLLSAVQL